MRAKSKNSMKENETIEAKVKSFLDAVGLDVSLETLLEEEVLYFNVKGPDENYFLNNKGDILKGISYIFQDYKEKHFPKSDLSIKFDAANFLKSRETELLAMADEAVTRLAQPGDEVALEPLNPYERRIVHMALEKRPELKTESRGDGYFKRLVIRLAGD